MFEDYSKYKTKLKKPNEKNYFIIWGSIFCKKNNVIVSTRNIPYIYKAHNPNIIADIKSLIQNLNIEENKTKEVFHDIFYKIDYLIEENIFNNINMISLNKFDYEICFTSMKNNLGYNKDLINFEHECKKTNDLFFEDLMTEYKIDKNELLFLFSNYNSICITDDFHFNMIKEKVEKYSEAKYS